MSHINATQTVKDATEAYIDDLGVARLLDALADVCRDKAEHLESNWQDHAAGHDWEHAAKQIDQLACRVRV